MATCRKIKVQKRTNGLDDLRWSCSLPQHTNDTHKAKGTNGVVLKTWRA